MTYIFNKVLQQFIYFFTYLYYFPDERIVPYIYWKTVVNELLEQKQLDLVVKMLMMIILTFWIVIAKQNIFADMHKTSKQYFQWYEPALSDLI